MEEERPEGLVIGDLVILVTILVLEVIQIKITFFGFILFGPIITFLFSCIVGGFTLLTLGLIALILIDNVRKLIAKKYCEYIKPKARAIWYSEVEWRKTE
jgi:hypothetical protein